MNVDLLVIFCVILLVNAVITWSILLAVNKNNNINEENINEVRRYAHNNFTDIKFTHNVNSNLRALTNKVGYEYPPQEKVVPERKEYIFEKLKK